MRPVIVTRAAVLTGPAAVIPVVANDLVGGREGGGVRASYITELCLPHAVQTQNLKAHHLGLDQRMSS